MGDPQNHGDAQLQLRARLSRMSRRWRATRALACGAVTAAAVHLVFAVAGALGTAPPHALGWMFALALAVAATVGMIKRPAPLWVARWFDIRLRQLEPTAPPDRVVCAVALLHTPTPNPAGAFARLAVAQAARAVGRFPSRAFAPPLPTRACLTAAVLGMLALAVPLGWRHSPLQQGLPAAKPIAAHLPPRPSTTVLKETRAFLDARSQVAAKAKQATLRAQAAEMTTQALMRSLAATPLTQDLAAALSARDGLQLEQAIQQLQQSLTGPTSAGAAQALSAAFAQASQDLPEAAPASLSGNSRDGSGNPATNDQTLPDLQRLQKQLDEAAAACSRDPAACAQELAELAPELDKLAREEARAEAEALADRLRRDDGNGVQSANQAPNVEAVPQSAADEAGSPKGTQAADGTAAEAGAQGQSNAASPVPLPSAAGVASTQSQTQAGPPAPPPAGGHALEVPVEVPATAPSRAELVSATARGGFSEPAYRATYAAYRTVVEDVLERAQVPASRRETVRRYFHRIRPTAHPQTRSQR